MDFSAASVRTCPRRIDSTSNSADARWVTLAQSPRACCCETTASAISCAASTASARARKSSFGGRAVGGASGVAASAIAYEARRGSSPKGSPSAAVSLAMRAAMDAATGEVGVAGETRFVIVCSSLPMGTLPDSPSRRDTIAAR